MLENISLDKDSENTVFNKPNSIYPYKGFKESPDINRILLVTHGGFIMELINVIRNKKGREILKKNDTMNTALYVIKIYCTICNGVCKCSSECSDSKLEFDFILFNDNSHCKNLI